MTDASLASIRVAATLENLKVIRAFVEERAQMAGFAGERLDDLVLAVDEAATNIILHGYRDWQHAVRPVIEVDVSYDAPTLWVRLRDQARPFDPTATPVIDELPPLTERGPGGLGIFLIRKTMDEFRYRRTPEGWNELLLAVHKRPAPEEE